MSVAGGLPRAVDRAELHGCDTLQVFTRSTGQWRAREIPDAEVTAFRRRIAETAIGPVVSHASYLINLAAAPGPLRRRSREAFGDELDRAERLGLLGVVIHPGAHGVSTESAGLGLVADAIAEALAARPDGSTMVLLEATAGQGTSLGHRFEQLAQIIDLAGRALRVGVCLDTCHLWAAGYDLVSQAGYRRTFEEFDDIVGLDRLRAMHLNDSKKGRGSRVDRHEHIGKGSLGLMAFAQIVRDRRFAAVPMILETPKRDAGPASRVARDANDVRNLALLRRLMRRGVSRAGPRRTPRPRT